MRNVSALTPLQGVAAVVVSLALPLVASFVIPMDMRMSFLHATGTAAALIWPLWVENSTRRLQSLEPSRLSLVLFALSVIIGGLRSVIDVGLGWVPSLAVVLYLACIVRPAIQVASVTRRKGMAGTTIIAVELFLIPFGIYFVLRALRHDR
jgi:hypothetical protein